jgi:hypothetical protein
MAQIDASKNGPTICVERTHGSIRTTKTDFAPVEQPLRIGAASATDKLWSDKKPSARDVTP